MHPPSNSRPTSDHAYPPYHCTWKIRRPIHQQDQSFLVIASLGSVLVNYVLAEADFAKRLNFKVHRGGGHCRTSTLTNIICLIGPGQRGKGDLFDVWRHCTSQGFEAKGGEYYNPLSTQAYQYLYYNQRFTASQTMS